VWGRGEMAVGSQTRSAPKGRIMGRIMGGGGVEEEWGRMAVDTHGERI
jgi:hypothetical protein